MSLNKLYLILLEFLEKDSTALFQSLMIPPLSDCENNLILGSSIAGQNQLLQRKTRNEKRRKNNVLHIDHADFKQRCLRPNPKRHIAD